MLGSIEPVRVPTGCGRIAVHEVGAGRPTLLWHGLAADASSWGYVLPALLPGRRLLLVDGPGWGRSDRGRARFPAVVAAAVAVVAALSPGEPVDWVGNGWGARIGLAVAAERPEAVRSLALSDADPRPMPAAERAALRRTVAALRIIGPVGPVGRALVADRLSPASRTEPQTVGAMLDALLLAGRIGAARSIARFELHRTDLTALLPRITAPTLLVAGDADSRWPTAEADRIAALAPFAAVTTVPEARALVPLDAPAALAAAIRAFWTGLDAGRCGRAAR